VGEALLSGVPSIVTNNSALKEWVDDENCFGISYPPKNELLVPLINSVIWKKSNYSGVLDWNEVANELVKVYEC